MDLNAFAINAAIVMDVLWNARNAAVNQSQAMITGELVLDAKSRYLELVSAWETMAREAGLEWSTPFGGVFEGRFRCGDSP